MIMTSGRHMIGENALIHHFPMISCRFRWNSSSLMRF
jgi:hypothetical protein